MQKAESSQTCICGFYKSRPGAEILPALCPQEALALAREGSFACGDAFVPANVSVFCAAYVAKHDCTVTLKIPLLITARNPVSPFTHFSPSPL